MTIKETVDACNAANEALAQVIQSETIKEKFPKAFVVIENVVRFYRVHYSQTHEIFRLFGVQKREKTLRPSGSSWVSGKMGTIEVTCFFDDLPPTCRREKITRKIPKAQVVESNDEFTEIEEYKIVCSGGDEE